MSTGGVYVEFGAQATAAPPFRCEGTRLWAFVVEADRDRLGDLCHRVFSGPTGGDVAYEPMGHHLLLTFGEVARIVSLAPRFQNQGAVTERQVGIWVPVADRRTGQVAVFTPYMVVDNPLSLASGREVFGYPKSWGWITLPDDEGSVGCALDVFGGDFGAAAVRGRRRLLEVARPGGAGAADAAGASSAAGAAEAPPAAHQPWGRLADVVDHVRGLVGHHDLERLGSVVSDLFHRQVTQVFNKQVRAADGGDGADLVEVCEAPIEVSRLVGWPLLHSYDLVVSPLDTHPLGPELGLAGQEVGGGFHVTDLDFVLDVGRVVWPPAPASAVSSPVSVASPASAAGGAAASGAAPTAEVANAAIAAGDEVGRVRDDPEGRAALATAFYDGPVAPYARAQLAFMRWEIERGVLNPVEAPVAPAAPGSPWWRAVNEHLLRDQAEARALHLAGWASGGSSAAVGAWLSFLVRPSPPAWYLAHNASVAVGYLGEAALARQETEAEVALINLVLARVLFAQLLATEPGLAGGRLPDVGHFVGDPRTDAVGLVVDIPDLYPRHYPLTARPHHGGLLQRVEALGAAFVDDDIIEAQTDRLFAWAARVLAIANLPAVLDHGVPRYPWAVLGEADPAGSGRHRRISDLARLVGRATAEIYERGLRP